jgi:hypothetical protein
MRHPLLSGCRRGIIASILAPALCVATPASAEIFKCFTKDKTPLYQNFPCQFDSIDAVPSNLRTATTTFVPPAVPPAVVPPAVVPPATNQAKPKAAPVSAPPAVQQPDASAPRVGMTQDEIKTLLGEPLEIVQDEPGVGFETWRYLNRSVQIDRNQRVVDLQAW